VRAFSPVDLAPDDLQALWGNISCPILLVNGAESWASNPETDGRAKYFQNAKVVELEGAGHWVHHDKLAEFLKEVRAFL
jgi:pimeloyl-ACP methyl ester carboxylesterase